MTEETRELLKQLGVARQELDHHLDKFDRLGLQARRSGGSWREIAEPARVSPNTVHQWWAHAERRHFSLGRLRETGGSTPPPVAARVPDGVSPALDRLRARIAAERVQEA